MVKAVGPTGDEERLMADTEDEGEDKDKEGKDKKRERERKKGKASKAEGGKEAAHEGGSDAKKLLELHTPVEWGEGGEEKKVYICCLP